MANTNVVHSIKNKPQMQILLYYLKEHNEITAQAVQTLLGVKRTRAYSLIKQMKDTGLVTVLGHGENRKIVLK